MEKPVSTLGKKLSPYLRIAAVIIVLMLLLFAALRFQTWKGEDNRQVLVLVNPWNPVSEAGYSTRLVQTEGGFMLDQICVKAMERMLADCRSAGCHPSLTSAWRSVDDQLVLYDEEVHQRTDTGLTPEQADAEVARWIAVPGRSEHELGLAVDIVDADNPVRDERQAETPTAQWLEQNAWKYGFIQRYPQRAEAVTGYAWHPWHYRYVGEDAAGNIQSLGITLEEYLAMFYSEEASVVYEEG